jgi:hypothetical protein
VPALEHVDDLLDTDRYPLDDVDLIATARRQFFDEGVCILPGFVRAEWIPALVSECDQLATLAHRSLVQGTPYLGLPDESFPDGHARRVLVDNSLEAVAYDQFPPDSLLRQLYEWDPLKTFIAEVLAEHELHRYADPFGALNVAVMRDGDVLGWHFDMTDFVVSLAIQSSLVGGHFLNAQQLRNLDPDDPDGVDEAYEAVLQVIADDAASTRVRTEPMTPGTLMLFNGRTSLHKVSAIRGDVPRYVALLAYDTKPGTDSSELLKLVRYGRLP